MKEFLSQKGIHYTERDVATDTSALNELRQKGFASVPVTFIDGQSVVGFDRAKIEELLSRPGRSTS